MRAGRPSGSEVGAMPMPPFLGKGSILEPGDRDTLKFPGHPNFSISDGDQSLASKKDCEEFTGKQLSQMGHRILQRLIEVTPLRSKPMGRVTKGNLFPLPTSLSLLEGFFPNFSAEEMSWLVSVCVSLNSIWGDEVFSDREISGVAANCLKLLAADVSRVCRLEGKLEVFEWDQFFATRSVDYKGDEVRNAQSFCWANIAPALPAEIGRVPLQEVCAQGARFYVENFDMYLKPRDRWELKRSPRVMVSDQDWAPVCSGLLSSGICRLLPAEEVFDTGSGLLLNGLFGVSKDEWVEGREVMRLIMNLVPLNGIAAPLQGDVETLPMWSLMTPFFLQPGEQLLISSEDVRCFFYTMSVPSCWSKYMAFNKLVPDECLPESLKGQDVYLASQVLPMGFSNSVSLAQHVHRNLALWSGACSEDDGLETNLPQGKIRKDKACSVANPNWRIYLDNYDLLERVASTGARGCGAWAKAGIREVGRAPQLKKGSFSELACRSARCTGRW